MKKLTPELASLLGVGEPCEMCGCTPDDPCQGGCTHDPNPRIGTMGRCTACLPPEMAMMVDRAVHGTHYRKRHEFRRKDLNNAEVIQLCNGHVCCVICHREPPSPEEWRMTHNILYDPGQPRFALALLCVEPGQGCFDLIGRIMRGTRYGSLRYLQRLQAYREADHNYRPEPELVDDRCRRVAQHLRSQDARTASGTPVTAEFIAGIRGGDGPGCRACRMNQGSRGSRGRHRRTALHVDHNHSTGVVRGLLCGGCNHAVRLLDKLPEAYEQARWILQEAPGFEPAEWYRKAWP